ncbi:MAG: hypothetical protein IJN72_04280 [Firmicutes bacterium]|nr:hypothetical protein [Bacillota bacterium]
MKKFLVLLLALMMVLTSFTACGNSDDAEVGGDDVQQEQEQQPVDGENEGEAEGEGEAEQQPADEEENKEEDKTEEPADKEEEKKPESDKKEENKKEEDKKPADKKEDDKKEESKPAANYGNAVELLTNVWATYGEAELFPAGYIDEAGNMVDGPAKIGTADGETLDALLGVPADKAGSIDNASIMMHMMNANTFTGGAYKTSDAKGLSDSIQANLANRQWMCGFPDILVTIQVEDYLISAFGNAELIETFKNKVTATYGNAKVLCEEPLAF